MPKATFSLAAAITSSADIAVDSSGISLKKINYATNSFHRFYLNDDYFGGPLNDIAGYATSIHGYSIQGGTHFPYYSASAPVTGRCFKFNGTSSYIRVDTFDGVLENTDFTLKALIFPLETSSYSLISSVGDSTVSKHEWFVESGKIHFRWKDLYGDINTLDGQTVSGTAVQAVYLSFGEDEIVFKMSGYPDIVYTGSNHYITYNADPLYIGGSPDINSGFYEGYIGKFQYEAAALGSTASFTVSNLYNTASPYVDLSCSLIATPVIYNLSVKDYQEKNCALGALISSDSGANWYYHNGSAWTLVSPATTFGSIAALNKNLSSFTFSGSTQMDLRIFLNSNGLDGGGISTSYVNYIHSNTASSFIYTSQLIWGQQTNLLENSFISSSLRTGEAATLFLADSIMTSPYSYSPLLNSSSWNNRNQMLQAARYVIDEYWAPASSIISTVSDFSVSKFVYLSAGNNSGAPYADADGATVSIRGLFVTISSYRWDSEYDTPTISVYDISADQETLLIDNHGLTASGPVFLSLPPSSYKFHVTTEAGAEYEFSRTISTDSEYEFRATPNDRKYSQPISVKGIDIISDTFFAVQGDSPTITVQITDSNTKLPFDLSGYTAFFRAREAYGDTLKINRQCNVIDEKYGKVRVQLTPSDTDTSGRYLCEIRLKKNNDNDYILTSLPRFYLDINGSIG